jgi:hypothetical protein
MVELRAFDFEFGVAIHARETIAMQYRATGCWRDGASAAPR